MDRTWSPTVTVSHVLMHFEIDGGRIVATDDFPLNVYAWEREFSAPGHLVAMRAAAREMPP